MGTPTVHCFDSSHSGGCNVGAQCDFDLHLSNNIEHLFVFLGPHLQHMEVPSLEIELELQLPAYTTATAMPDPSHVCDLHHSSWQHRILNPLSEARDRTHNLMVPSRICFHCTMKGTP